MITKKVKTESISLLFKRYGFFGFLKLSLDILLTRLFWPGNRLLRRPYYIRGRQHILIGPGFTSGVGLRIDAFSQKAEYLVEIGKNVEVNDYVHIAAINSVKIGDNVLIASKVFITDHNHGSYTGEEQVHPDQPPGQRTLYSKEVLIENNVWLGEGTVVMPGVKIGKGSIVASNSVVTKSIAPYTIVAGSPAKAIKRFNVKTNKWEKLYK